MGMGSKGDFPMRNPFPNWTGFSLVSGLSGSVPLAGDKGFTDRRSREIPIAIESPVLSLLREMHAKYLTMRDGTVADYIPELARVGADQFGIALATVDGHVYEVGDADSPFTVQSIS